MSYTITADKIETGMTITEETKGIKRALTVATIDREEDWVTLWTAERGAACIRPDTQVTVEGDRPVSMYPVHTVLRVPGIGSIVKIGEAGSAQWIDAHDGGSIMPGIVDRFDDVSVVYTPEAGSDDEVTEVPDVVQKWKDWERNNIEWRKHKWEDKDGDVWEWDENKSLWYLVNANGTIELTSGKHLLAASFPLSRIK